MKNALRLLCLAAVLAVAARTPATALPERSVCWLTCCNNGMPVKCHTTVSPPDYTEAQCCSGEAVQCPPGQTAAVIAWGSPAELCPPS